MSRHMIALMLITTAVSLSLPWSPTFGQALPCQDSDGDGWADPEAATDSCQSDNCPGIFNPDQLLCANTGDPVPDGVLDVLDVTRTIDHAFRGLLPDATDCIDILIGGTDVNCDGATTIVDVIKVIDVAFRGTEDDFCKPCHCDCYPSSCPELSLVNNLLPNNGSFERHCVGTLTGWDISPWNPVGINNSAAPAGGEWAAEFSSGEFPAHIETPVSGPLDAGIYRISSWTRVTIPLDGDSCCAWLTLTDAAGINYYPVILDSQWRYSEFIDTLVPTGPGSSLEFGVLGAGNPFLPAFKVIVDRVSLEYLGHSAP